MCFKFSSGGSYRSAATKAAAKENESAKNSAKNNRLLKTNGKDYGEKLDTANSADVRRIFGN